MKCRIIKIEDYYQGQILVPVACEDNPEKTERYAWQEIYDGAKYTNLVSARTALKIFVEDVVRKPVVIEEFEL